MAGRRPLDPVLAAGARVWRALPAPLRVGVLHAANPRFLVGVVGLIRNEDGRILLLRHRFRTPWEWGLPGGFLRRSESMDAALARELREETGLEVTVEPQVLDVEHNGLVGYFSMTLAGWARERPLAPSPEIIEGGFYPAAALPEGVYPHHLAVIRRFEGLPGSGRFA